MTLVCVSLSAWMGMFLCPSLTVINFGLFFSVILSGAVPRIEVYVCF